MVNKLILAASLVLILCSAADAKKQSNMSKIWNKTVKVCKKALPVVNVAGVVVGTAVQVVRK